MSSLRAWGSDSDKGRARTAKEGGCGWPRLSESGPSCAMNVPPWFTDEAESGAALVVPAVATQ